MDIQNSGNGLDKLLLQILQQREHASTTTTLPPIKAAKKPNTQDVVSLSGQKSNNQGANKQTKLVKDNVEDTENGFRRTQEFEKPNGKKFTRIEDVATSEERSKRVVIQQNELGSTTALENIIDRLENGSFRLIQRYTDEVGETKTNVTLDFNPKDADVLLGRPPSSISKTDNPFQTLRGTQVDLRA